MKYYKLGHFVAFFLFLVGCITLQAGEGKVGYFTPENVYRFAMHLYEEGDYLRAAGEFQRYLYGCDLPVTKQDSILYKIGLCYRLGGNISKGIEYFHKIINSYPESRYVDQSFYQIALSYHLAHSYSESNAFLNFHLSDIAQKHIKLRMQRLSGLNYIKQKKWDKAISFLERLDTSVEKDSTIDQLLKFAKEGPELLQKSKFWAGLFSSIIPGTGKIYCNRPRDGLFSLLIIGLTAWQAHEGFRKDGSRSVKGWLLGTTSAVFYFGNIYGSVAAAKIYNERQEEKLLNKVEVSINVDFH